MKSVIEKLESEISVLDERAKAKEAILKCVFSSLESTSEERGLVHKILGVTPKVPVVSRCLTLKQQWCLGFEDAVCASFAVVNSSERSHMQPVCHILDGNGIVRCLLLDGEGAAAPFIRSSAPCELLIGFSKSLLFNTESRAIVLELILYPSTGNCPDDAEAFIRSTAARRVLQSEKHIIQIRAPSKWYSITDLLSAKEQEMEVLLRCLQVGSFVLPLSPTSSLEFAEKNPDFDCCDFGDWQVFVGHHIMNGLVALSSSFKQPNGNIDRLYGINPHLLNEFARGDNRSLLVERKLLSGGHSF